MKFDVKATLQDYPLQLLESKNLGNNIRIVSSVNRIIVAGMGGSGMPGDFLKTLLKRDLIPFEVVKEYTLPNYVNKNTLVFIISYSGNTEETISMYSDALKKNAKVIVITSGGKLSFLVHESNAKLIKVPSGLLPRHAFFFLLIPIINILISNNLTTLKLNLNEINSLLRNKLWTEKAKDLANKLYNKTPLIYATPKFKPIARRWKIMFNENSKIHAFHNVFPEWNHNELQGFELLKNDYHVIFIQDEKEKIKMKKRILACKEILKNQGVPVTELVIRGTSHFTKLISASYLGDWTSYYLALKNKVDPGPIKLTESLKIQLK